MFNRNWQPHSSNRHYFQKGGKPSFTRYRGNINKYRKYNRACPPPVRSPSPLEGSEEHFSRKIKTKSAQVMRMILSPDEPIATTSINISLSPDFDVTPKFVDKTKSPKSKPISPTRYTTKEVYDKIMSFIAKSNRGRIETFINADGRSDLDNALQHMQMQKKLEISRMLRNLKSSNLQEDNCSWGMIASDVGIRIEDLQPDVVEELQLALNLDLENLELELFRNPQETVTNIEENQSSSTVIAEVKQEVVEPDACSDELDTSQEQLAEVKSELEDISEDYSVDNKPDTCSGELNVSQEQLAQIKSELEDISEDYSVDNKPDTCSGELDVSQEQLAQVKSELEDISEEYSVDNNSNTLSDSAYSSHQSSGEVPVNQEETYKDSELDSLLAIENAVTCTMEQSRREGYFNQFCIQKKFEIIDYCMEQLSNYRKSLTHLLLENSVLSSSSRMKDGLYVGTNTPESCGKEPDLMRSSIKRKASKDVARTKLYESCKRPNRPLTFDQINERVCVIERHSSELIVGTNKGNVIFLSLEDGKILTTIDVTNAAITSLVVGNKGCGTLHLFVGCTGMTLSQYNLMDKSLKKVFAVDYQIQCMDFMWSNIYMGCRNGYILKYSYSKDKIDFTCITDSTDIMSIKASCEGPRKILICGHRSAPISVRDAMTGMLLRSFSDPSCNFPTVYSLVLDGSRIYCATAKDDILVFAFHDGKLLKRLVADQAKGVSCLQLTNVNKRLYAGCYNGSIYVFDLERDGQCFSILENTSDKSRTIVCLQVLEKQVVFGTLSNGLSSVEYF